MVITRPNETIIPPHAGLRIVTMAVALHKEN